MPANVLRCMTILLLVVVGVVAVPAPASARLQGQVNAYLAAHPGGKQIGANEISYGDGAFIVSVAPESGIQGVPDCPSGWFCFYDKIFYGYPRGKLSDCGWQDLAWWGWQDRTESVHHNQSSGTVSFIDETGSTDTVIFWVSPGKRTIADVNPHRNKANYVYRACV